MDSPPVRFLRSLLLAAADRHRGDVLAKNYGYVRPDPGKLIREGLAIARSIVESARPAPDPAAWLDALADALTAAHDTQDADGTSADCWDDEDGYILAGINDVRRDVDRLREAVRRAGRIDEEAVRREFRE
jgi:hypothetical protein